jgi:large subunit ribosomal protein L23
MGFFDRFTKKKQKEQLEQVAKFSDEKKQESLSKTTNKKESTTNVTKMIAKQDLKKVDASNVLVQPLISEKASIMGSQDKYTFIVKNKASKHQIKQAIKELYGVEPIKVNVANIAERKVRFGRTFGVQSGYRKAVATLPKGKSIAVHEGV